MQMTFLKKKLNDPLKNVSDPIVGFLDETSLQTTKSQHLWILCS